MERVYVGNLPQDISIRDIDDFFRPFGKLVYIDMHIRNDPVFAFIQFDGACDAYNAVRDRNGYDYEGYTLKVKLVEKSNDRCFEVGNPCDEETPPPPPMFTQSNQCEFHNNVFTNPSSLLQSKWPPENMVQYRHSNVSSHNNIAYPTYASNKYPQNCNINSQSSLNYDERSSMSRRSRNISNREGQPEARKEMRVLDKKLTKMDNSNNPNNIKQTSANENQGTDGHWNKAMEKLRSQSAESDKTDVKSKRRRNRKSIGSIWKARYSKAIFILDKIDKNILNGTVHEGDAEDRVKYEAVVDEFLKFNGTVPPSTSQKNDLAKRNHSQSNGSNSPKRKN